MPKRSPDEHGPGRTRRRGTALGLYALFAVLVLVLTTTALATAGQGGLYKLIAPERNPGPAGDPDAPGTSGSPDDSDLPQPPETGSEALPETPDAVKQATTELLGELAGVVVNLEPILEKLEPIDEATLIQAEVEGQPNLREALDLTETIRANDPLIQSLSEEVVAAGAEAARSIEAFRIRKSSLSDSSLRVLRDTIYSIRMRRWTLNGTAGDITVELDQLVEARQAHDWDTVLRQLKMVEAVQRARIDELRELLRLFGQAQSLLR